MAQGNHYDVIIVGTGAGGDTLARKLAPTPKDEIFAEYARLTGETLLRRKLKT
jgi:pyruvate/2-oxoglutarate dehydrogenase complex dihydrolipoamide dehydrogenase (E3) component